MSKGYSEEIPIGILGGTAKGISKWNQKTILTNS